MSDDDLTRELAALGRSVPLPSDESLESAVLARLDQRPAPLVTRARLAAVVLALLAGLVAVPPVRAAIVEWFGFGGVRVTIDPGVTTSGSATPPPVTGTLTLAEAQRRVGFTPFVLPTLGEPTGIEVLHQRRVLSMGWPGGLRLDQTRSLRYTFGKESRSVRFVTVDGRDALWFADAHELLVYDARGGLIEETRRAAGPTLVWTAGGTTLRLEAADLTLARAIDLAESAHPGT